MLCMQILRVMADGDKCDIIYLPPRNAGDRLPVELLDAYEGHYSVNCINDFIRLCSSYTLHLISFHNMPLATFIILYCLSVSLQAPNPPFPQMLSAIDY